MRRRKYREVYRLYREYYTLAKHSERSWNVIPIKSISILTNNAIQKNILGCAVSDAKAQALFSICTYINITYLYLNYLFSNLPLAQQKYIHSV